MLQIKPGIKIRHQNTLDVDLKVMGVINDYGDSIGFLTSYWNRHWKFVIHSEMVAIKKDQLYLWKDVTDEKV